MILLSSTVSAQKVTVTPDGNYISVAKSEPVKTDKLFKSREGIIYPVYLNSKGNPFIFRISKKTGKVVRSYLKVTP